ncbi:hypothetical protein IGK09_000322 [Enterococcus sp. AZ014]
MEGVSEIKIAVYCGASKGNSPEFERVTRSLGEWIGENEYQLVYGGGNAGLKGIIADSVLGSGGKVTGIMPDFLAKRELAKKMAPL